MQSFVSSLNWNNMNLETCVHAHGGCDGKLKVSVESWGQCWPTGLLVAPGKGTRLVWHVRQSIVIKLSAEFDSVLNLWKFLTIHCSSRSIGSSRLTKMVLGALRTIQARLAIAVVVGSLGIAQFITGCALGSDVYKWGTFCFDSSLSSVSVLGCLTIHAQSCMQASALSPCSRRLRESGLVDMYSSTKEESIFKSNADSFSRSSWWICSRSL